MNFTPFFRVKSTGDFGGPLYLISGTTQTVVGIASSSPDLRPATPCLDGHATTHMQVAAFATWITATIAT
jgi:secreted trypsin-like serine protease